MPYAQRYNPESDVMELYDTDSGSLIMSSPVSPLSQNTLNKYRSFPDFQPPASAMAPTVTPTPSPLPSAEISGRGATGSFEETPQEKVEGTFYEPKSSTNPLLSALGDNPKVSQGFSQMRQGFIKSQEEMAKAANESVAIQQEYNKAIQAEQERTQVREKERMQALDQAQNDYRALSDEIRNTQVDPNRYYASQTTGQKISTAIGLALSSIGDAAQVYAGRGRADNLARTLGIINSAIDRDIDLQKFQIGLKQKGAGDRLNIYNMMLKKFGDEQQAEQATKLFMLEDTKNKLLETQMRYKAPQIQANMQEMLGKLGVEEQKTQSDLSDSIYNRIAKALAAGGAKQVPAPQAATIGDVDKALDVLKSLESSFLGDKASGKPAKVGVFSGLTQYGPGNVSSAAQYSDEQKVAAQMIGLALESGKLQASDYPRYLAMMPQPGDSAARAKNKIATLRSSLNAMKKRQIGALTGAGFATGGLGSSKSVSDIIPGVEEF